MDNLRSASHRIKGISHASDKDQEGPTLLHHFISPAQSLKSIDFFALKISKERTILEKRQGESFIVILSGQADFSLGSNVFKKIGQRETVFKGQAFGLFVPAGQEVLVDPLGSVKIAVAVCLLKPKNKKLEPFLIRPGENRLRKVGRGRYSRKVFDILSREHPADYLLVGETFSLPGMWSSYPPHKHDQSIAGKETSLEEIYFYQSENPERFGIQCLYSPDKKKDTCYRIGHNDAFAIPYGFHPVSAPPDSKFYYLWILAGKERELRVSEDPQWRK